MDSYVDLTLRPDAELPLNRLLNAVYTKLHKTFCDESMTDIGVSFPNYQVTLGNLLRLHGSAETLQLLLEKNWLGGMSGYCKIRDILPVPTGCKHRTVSRIQTTMSQSKLKRLIKRGSITEREAKTYKAKMFTKGLENPYVELVSGSNGHKHRRYIEFSPLLDEPVDGEFDQFGLSKTTTIPWF